MKPLSFLLFVERYNQFFRIHISNYTNYPKRTTNFVIEFSLIKIQYEMLTLLIAKYKHIGCIQPQ